MQNFNNPEALGGETQVQPGHNQLTQTTNTTRDEIISSVGRAYSITDNVCSIRANDTTFVKVLDEIVEHQKCGRVVSYGMGDFYIKMYQFPKPLSWAEQLMADHSKSSRRAKKGGAL